ncbi:hypothetical protein BC831DRAFT_482387 [Entophlyctis helioformis]|nr:hypothetical protein BC831DRAFT_482387 [Entophlyctis helioformis]
MAGSPQPLAPFQQPAIDMSDLTLLALHNADCMFLISPQEWTLSSVVLQMIQATWPAGLAEERDVPDSAVAARLFKLRGDPFLCTGEASATAKRLVLTIMARFANYGLRYVNDVRPMSTTLTGMPTLLFGDAPPARRAPHFGLALGGNNKVRLIAPCQDDPNTLTEQAMQEAQSAIGGVLEDIAGQACSVALIAGEPEWTLLPGSFDLQSNDSDSMRRTRLLVGMAMARLAPLGWTMVGTPSLSGSRQQSDIVVFARFE